ncbi:uncharacterized protein LOC109864165 isoform X2 [Pseudomyrmex gracilis]|uniref:uncharacterized protein LOC109864165 isoform X2 n=1 Tax=Pseudomyrmex gracilis TaxID=219809 RepID=UPI0009949CC2|nr:uncharacterized protein LOC109864165 isoform X2 [Pseudomyrmex gracilis]
MRTITKTGGIGLETVMEKYPQATEPNDRGVDLLLQKTDQSAHVPFKHEFKNYQRCCTYLSTNNRREPGYSYSKVRYKKILISLELTPWIKDERSRREEIITCSAKFSNHRD